MNTASSMAMPMPLRELLLEVFGPGIEEVRLVEYSWINALHGWPLAVTRRQRIYLRYSAADFFADAELVVHEYHHVMKQWNTGRLTVLRYLCESVRHGYWNNPFEVEARDMASRHARSYSARQHGKTK
ncbi:MAG: hypothetical protein ABIP38_04040 [Steroidobacteraceae bacterium]